jgi:hypothetical protein
VRRLIYALVAAVALAAAGLAIAGSGSPQAIRTVGGTFSATSVSDSRTQTCTNADGTFTFTTARYTGIATSSEPSLNGPIALQVRSAINTTKKVGTVDGALRIDVASGRRTEARFSAVFVNGQLSGLATGQAHDPNSRLVANVSADFGPTAGFGNGHLGGTSGGGAVQLQPGRCRTSKPVAEHSEARGTVSALSATSITVGGLTCTIPADANLAARLAKVKMTDRASIRCRLVNGQNTLLAISAKGGSKH